MRFLKHHSIFLFLMPLWMLSQEILILDGVTGFPLEGVALFNSEKTKAIITNQEGKAPLSVFSEGDSLNIQFYGFETLKIFLGTQEFKNGVSMALEPKDQTLEEVILSVGRNAVTRKQIAEKVAVIDAQTIELQRPSTGADLVGLSPGVRIQKSQGGGGSPIIRGFEANRILMVVDGVRMNNAIYRSGHLQNAITVNPNTVERVEVIYGSSSVAYGSDALGGVIHYYTKSPLINSKEKSRSSFSSDFSSANLGTVNSFSTELSFNKWASLTSISYSNFGDIRMGTRRAHGYANWGLTPFYSENSRSAYQANPTLNENPNIQKNTAYNQLDLFQKFLVKLNDENQLVFNFQYSNSSDIPRDDKLIEQRSGTLRYAEWFYGPQKRILIAPQLKLFPQKRFMNSGRITFAYQNIDESRNSRAFESFIRKIQKENVQVWSLNGDFEFELNQKHSFSYGFEGTFNKVRSFAFGKELVVQQNEVVALKPSTPFPTRYPSKGSTYDSFASFVNWIWDLNNELTVNFGMRFTNTNLEARWKEYYNINALLEAVNLDALALTQTLALTYRPTEKIQWNLILSNGFRNPNIDDVGKIRENNGILVVPNPFLYPEYAYNFELGIKRYFDQSKNYLSLRGFSTLISRHIGRSNYIIFSDTTTPDQATIRYNGEEVETYANNNLGNRYLYGGSLDGYYSLNTFLALRGNLSFIQAVKSEKYGPLPSISPAFGRIFIEYQKSNWLSYLSFEFSDNKNIEAYSIGGEDGLEETPLLSENPLLYAGTPAWSELSWLAQYRWKKSTSFRITLENILDTHYRPFASGISAPGRNLK
ncbi:MAG: TonB-dependent receptor, partial [Flavobacteriaceae bacterium]